MGNSDQRGRLGEEFRARTKRFAAGTIRLFVKLPEGPCNNKFRFWRERHPSGGKARGRECIRSDTRPTEQRRRRTGAAPPRRAGALLASGFVVPQSQIQVDMLHRHASPEAKIASSKIGIYFCTDPIGRDELRVLGKQLLRSGTSVAAHVREASRARSDEEFVSKLGGALQEADESQLWLELLREECRLDPALAEPLEREAHELIAILTTIINKTKGKN